MIVVIALRSIDDHFIINGDYRASEDGIYEYNDDEFDYNKAKGLITAEGPLRNPIVVLVKKSNRTTSTSVPNLSSILKLMG